MRAGKYGALEPAAAKLSTWLISKALAGLPPLASAAELAAQYDNDPRHPHAEARIEALVRWEIGKNFTAGFVSNLGGILTLPLALSSNLAATWLLQARMAAALAALRGHSLEDPAVQTMVLLSLVGGSTPTLLRNAGVRFGEALTERAVARLSEDALLNINRRVGFGLLSTSTERGLVSLSKAAPVVGALFAGGFDAYGCHRVAKSARRLFMPRGLLPATTASTSR